MYGDYPECENESECWYQQDEWRDTRDAKTVRYKENYGFKYECYTKSSTGGDFYFCDKCSANIGDDIPTTKCSLCSVNMVDTWIEMPNGFSYCIDCIEESSIMLIQEDIAYDLYFKEFKQPRPTGKFSDDAVDEYIEERNLVMNRDTIRKSLRDKTLYKDQVFMGKLKELIESLHDEKNCKKELKLKRKRDLLEKNESIIKEWIPSINLMDLKEGELNERLFKRLKKEELPVFTSSIMLLNHFCKV